MDSPRQVVPLPSLVYYPWLRKSGASSGNQSKERAEQGVQNALHFKR